MKKITFLLFIFTLGLVLPSCSDDDDKKEELLKEYYAVVKELAAAELELKDLEKKMSTSKGGALLVYQQQISELYPKVEKLRKRKKELERELGIKPKT